MRILYFGTSSFALPTLKALVEQQHDVVAVVTQPDRPAGRGGKLTPPPVKELALQLGLPVLQPESCRTPEFLEIARGYAPELSVVAAYGQFLPDPLRLLPRWGTVNLHGSLLPKFRGAAPIQRAILTGEAKTGVCLMWMAREMDAGDVIDCRETQILPDDNYGLLSERLAHMAAELLLAWLPSIAADSAPHLPQDTSAVTLAPMLRKEEREIDWSRSAEEIWWQIRAFAPTPGAVTVLHGQPIKVLQALPLSSMSTGAPGILVATESKSGLIVATGNGTLRLLSVQPAGKRAMSDVEFLRGAHVAAGDRFGTEEP